MSGNDVKTQKLYKESHKLPFTLLADEKGSVAKKFGVPVNKGGSFKYTDEDGNVHNLVRGVTANRWTFVIDKAGKIAMVNNKVNAAEDSKKIIETVKNLK